MNWIGYSLVTVGFIGATLAASLDVNTLQWTWYAVALAGGIVGVGLLRWHSHQAKSAHHTLANNMHELKDCMAQVVDRLQSFQATPLSLDQRMVMHRTIDAEFAVPLRNFAEARESISHIHGLQVYADIMSSFATGERYLNRVWSASADGYVDEVAAFLPRAQEQFVECLDKLTALHDPQ